MICGQCLIDKHSSHGDFKYASDVIGVHLLELKQILPDMEKAIDSGKMCLVDVKAESVKLRESLNETVSSVNTYFAGLRDILNTKESAILTKIYSQAKKKEKRIQQHATALEQAVDAMTKTKLTVEDTIVRRAEEIDVLLEENQLRGKYCMLALRVATRLLNFGFVVRRVKLVNIYISLYSLGQKFNLANTDLRRKELTQI